MHVVVVTVGVFVTELNEFDRNVLSVLILLAQLDAQLELHVDDDESLAAYIHDAFKLLLFHDVNLHQQYRPLDV